MKQIDLREGAKRQHRAVTMYAALQCWVRGLDALVFKRGQLLRLLGLHRFKETRVDWLQEDFRELFPHQTVFVSGQSKSLGSLLASRKPMKGAAGHLSQQVKWCEDNGIVVEDFQLWQWGSGSHPAKDFEPLTPFFGTSVNSDERLLTCYLSLLASGQMSPLDIPKIK